MKKAKSMDKELDYETYKLNVREWVVGIGIIVGITGILSYAFYKSIVAFGIFMCPFKKYLEIYKDVLKEKRKQVLTVQFKELCMSLSAQLMAGYSMENGLVEVYRELKQMYGETYITKETKLIIRKMQMNINVEEAFKDLAKRSGAGDIRLFSDVLYAAKRTGGDMNRIVRETADSISRKLEEDRELNMMISGKKYEFIVMSIVPVFIVFYVSITAPGMMDVLYQESIGRIVATGCLGIYLLAVYLGRRMTRVEV